MLCCQKAVDWSKIRITLVHDGSEPFPEENFSGMPFEVNQVSIPHGGIAKARNWCIDHSEGEWIKFCDFDDMFSGAYAVQQMMDSLEKGQGYDLLWFDLIFDDHGKTSIRNHRDPVFVHNKVFRRTFLLQKGILPIPKASSEAHMRANLEVFDFELTEEDMSMLTCMPQTAWLEKAAGSSDRFVICLVLQLTRW